MGLNAVRGRLEGLSYDKPSYGGVDTVEKANRAAERIREYEEKVAAFKVVEADFSRICEQDSQQMAGAQGMVEDANRSLERDNLLVRNADLEAQRHFRENEEAYKADAVADAKAKGIDIQYPGYMRPRQQSQAEQPTMPAQPDVSPPPPTPES